MAEGGTASLSIKKFSPQAECDTVGVSINGSIRAPVAPPLRVAANPFEKITTTSMRCVTSALGRSISLVER